MKFLWRISNHGDLAGPGGQKSDGRWHTAARGKRVVYLAEHPAVALVEVLANLEGDPWLFPDTFQLVKIAAAGSVLIEVLNPDTLSGDWRTNLSETQALGDAWLESCRSALLAVPSVPSPESVNYLFNPLHKDAAGLVVVWCKRLRYDKRLFQIAVN